METFTWPSEESSDVVTVLIPAPPSTHTNRSLSKVCVWMIHSDKACVMWLKSHSHNSQFSFSLSQHSFSHSGGNSLCLCLFRIWFVKHLARGRACVEDLSHRCPGSPASHSGCRRCSVSQAEQTGQVVEQRWAELACLLYLKSPETLLQQRAAQEEKLHWEKKQKAGTEAKRFSGTPATCRLLYQSMRKTGLHLMQKKIAKSIINGVFITIHIHIHISIVLLLRPYLEACCAGFIGYYL